jgi:hypothetical protein
LIITFSQIDAPLESTISKVDEIVAPGTTAVIKVPPEDPVLGLTDTSFGVRSNVA